MNIDITSEILAVIPARGNSKGLPRKNLRLLANKPLIVYSVEAALKSDYINRVIVSTEDKEIAEIARTYGADVIYRPIDLAKDDTPMIDVILHVLDSLEPEYTPNIIVLLQPTSPLRDNKDINEAIELFLNEYCDAVAGVTENIKIYWSFRVKDGYIQPVFGDKYLKKRRQDLPPLYLPNGSIYIAKPDILKKYRNFYWGKILPYIMSSEKSIDIDTKMDFILAELLIKKQEEEKK